MKRRQLLVRFQSLKGQQQGTYYVCCTRHSSPACMTLRRCAAGRRHAAVRILLQGGGGLWRLSRRLPHALHAAVALADGQRPGPHHLGAHRRAHRGGAPRPRLAAELRRIRVAQHHHPRLLAAAQLRLRVHLWQRPRHRHVRSFFHFVENFPCSSAFQSCWVAGCCSLRPAGRQPLHAEADPQLAESMLGRCWLTCTVRLHSWPYR